MKNSNIKFLLFLFALTSGIVSCEDLIDEQPESEISPSSFWQNNSDAESGVIGVYDGMQASFRLKHYYWGEFRSDNFTRGEGSASADNLQVTSNAVTAGNSDVLRWDDFYEMINRSNLAIKYIPQISGFNTSLLAEAYALRAYAYFQAIKTWGSVPLFAEPIESQDQQLQRPRTDAATILNDIVIPDMLAAESNMEVFTDPYRFSLASIWGLQADVYSWIGDDVQAKAALQNIIDLNEYSLVDTPEAWQDLFLNDTGDGGGPSKVMTGPELIFSIRYDLGEARDNPGQTRANRSGIFSLFFAGLPSFYLSPILENKWTDKFPIDSTLWVEKYPDTNPVLTQTDALTGDTNFIYGDWRFYFCRENGVQGIGSLLPGEARLAKYNKANYSGNIDDSDIVLYRYSGILLLLAEIENRLGNVDEALDLVNQIRTARQLPLVEEGEFGFSEDERENFILDERQLELVGEAERWWDLRRNDKAIEVMNPILDTLQGGSLLTQERLLLPIFEQHIIENPLLEQTPGY